MPPKTGHIIEQLFKLAYLIISGTRTRAELCNLLQCSPATITREIAMLKECFDMTIEVQRQDERHVYEATSLGLISADALLRKFS